MDELDMLSYLINCILIGLYCLSAYFIFQIAKRNKIRKQERDAEEARIFALNPDNPDIKRLIDEAIDIINDMLEVGSAAQLFSAEDYEGFIMTFPISKSQHSGNVYNYSFYIKMYNVSNLENCKHKYPQNERKPNWQPYYLSLNHFIGKYRHNYDAAQKSYIVKTKNTALLHQNDQENLRRLLYNQVAQRCPLADMNGTPIHTKNVAR